MCEFLLQNKSSDAHDRPLNAVDHRRRLSLDRLEEIDHFLQSTVLVKLTFLRPVLQEGHHDGDRLREVDLHPVVLAPDAVPVALTLSEWIHAEALGF